MKRKERELTPAPGDLRIVQAFLNTANLKARTDALASPPALSRWLGEHRLAAVDVTAADVERVVRFRESLRAILITGSAGPELTGTLDAVVSTALLRPRFTEGAGLSLEPAATGADAAIAHVLASYVAAKGEGLLRRFKICASTICRNAFYDYSTNLTAKWCRPLCGNRLSAAAFRRRERARGR